MRSLSVSAAEEGWARSVSSAPVGQRWRERVAAPSIKVGESSEREASDTVLDCVFERTRVRGWPPGLESFGDVAQLVEHLLCKQGVVGSSPIVSTEMHSDQGVSCLRSARMPKHMA